MVGICLLLKDARFCFAKFVSSVSPYMMQVFARMAAVWMSPEAFNAPLEAAWLLDYCVESPPKKCKCSAWLFSKLTLVSAANKFRGSWDIHFHYLQYPFRAKFHPNPKPGNSWQLECQVMAEKLMVMRSLSLGVPRWGLTVLLWVGVGGCWRYVPLRRNPIMDNSISMENDRHSANHAMSTTLTNELRQWPMFMGPWRLGGGAGVTFFHIQ